MRWFSVCNSFEHKYAVFCASHTLLDALQICGVKLCCSIISSDVAEVVDITPL